MLEGTDLLKTALEENLARQLGPLDFAVAEAHRLLDEYTARKREGKSRWLLAGALRALGADPGPLPEPAIEQDERLRVVLQQIIETIDSPAVSPKAQGELEAPQIAPAISSVVAPAPIEAPAPAAVCEVAPESSAYSEPVLSDPDDAPCTYAEPSREVLLAARKVMSETLDLKRTFDQEPTIRLGLLVQALVAECRHLLSQIPDQDPCAKALFDSIRHLGYIKRAAVDQGFCQGLSMSHQADWQAVATAARTRLARYDVDAMQAIAAPSAAKHKKAKPSPEPKAPDEAPTIVLPKLTAAITDSRSLVMLGGIPVSDKVLLIRRKFGVELEWLDIDGTNRITAVCERIRAGRYVGVIVLEKLIGHKAFGPLRDACAAANMPFAYGDRGGTANVEKALLSIEAALPAAG